jgi:menaquinone-dependent protoporphyrinogen oxidase
MCALRGMCARSRRRAPLFMFRWHRDARGFLARHRKALAGMPAAVFALGPTHVPHDDAEWRNSRAQLENALSGFPWFAPAAVKVFGGKYDPASLRFPVRWLAGDVPASDIRDWASIRAWSEEMKSVLVAGFT